MVAKPTNIGKPNKNAVPGLAKSLVKRLVERSRYAAEKEKTSV